MKAAFPVALSAALVAALSALAQTHLSAVQRKNSDYAELAKAPEKARAKVNPLERNPNSIAAGANLFDQHCAECHGEDGEGRKKGPSLRVPQVQDAAPGALFWLLSNGVVRKGMPVWSKLPEPQRWQLVAFIKSLGVLPPADSSSKSGGSGAASISSSPPH
jgi:mono/diheme cytochrome c family protein